jgi:Sec7-like guanine-nucleotide exchange factor
MYKKKKYDLRIDHANKKIIIGKSFSHKQSDIESEEYKQLCSVVQNFPEYKVEVKQIKKNPHKESYRGLTYDYMEKYIQIRGTALDLENYNQLRLLAQCHSKRFPVIKQWFLKNYPEVEKYGAKQEFLTIQENAA